jgi:hypothetical protein
MAFTALSASLAVSETGGRLLQSAPVIQGGSPPKKPVSISSFRCKIHDLISQDVVLLYMLHGLAVETEFLVAGNTFVFGIDIVPMID